MKAAPLGTATAVAVLAAAGLVAAAPASASGIVVTSGASAYSAAGATGSAGLRATLALSGSLGGIIDSLISPIVTQDLNPLVSALSASTSSVVAATLGTASPLNAATTATQNQVDTAPAAFPNDVTPSPCSNIGAQPCYSGAATTLDGGLASASVGALSGYAEQVSTAGDATNPILGRAHIAGATVSALPLVTGLVPALQAAANPLVSATAIDAKANCPNDGAAGATKPRTAPTASLSTGRISLLGDLVTLDVVANQVADLVVNGVPYASLTALPTVTASGVTISSYGTSVLVAVPLSVNQVFAAAGLSDSIVSALTALAPTSTVALRLVVGPNAAVTNNSVQAWGLGVGVDLSGALSFNVSNLATATVTLPSGLGGSNIGNLLDLRLGYTACQSGTTATASTPLVPAALV